MDVSESKLVVAGQSVNRRRSHHVFLIGLRQHCGRALGGVRPLRRPDALWSTIRRLPTSTSTLTIVPYTTWWSNVLWWRIGCHVELLLGEHLLLPACDWEDRSLRYGRQLWLDLIASINPVDDASGTGSVRYSILCPAHSLHLRG